MEEGCLACHQDMSIHGHVRIKHATQVLDMRHREDIRIADPNVGDVDDLLQLLTCANDEELSLIIVDQGPIS